MKKNGHKQSINYASKKIYNHVFNGLKYKRRDIQLCIFKKHAIMYLRFKVVVFGKLVVAGV